MCYPINEDNSFGESKNNDNKYLNLNHISRVIEHIELLGNIANLMHQNTYCEQNNDKSYTIKNRYKNTITRLFLYEFALYSHKPIAEDEFSYIIHQLDDMAKKFQDNVHLLLSSFIGRK